MFDKEQNGYLNNGEVGGAGVTIIKIAKLREIGWNVL